MYSNIEYKNAQNGDEAMDGTQPRQEPSLAQVQERKELKRRYSIYNNEILLHWMEAVTGSHREAMVEILRERGAL